MRGIELEIVFIDELSIIDMWKKAPHIEVLENNCVGKYSCSTKWYQVKSLKFKMIEMKWENSGTLFLSLQWERVFSSDTEDWKAALKPTISFVFAIELLGAERGELEVHNNEHEGEETPEE